MSRLTISLKMIKEAKFEHDFLIAIKNHINKAITQIGNGPTSKIQGLIRYAITSQPEWQSLRDGKLQQDFGLPDGHNIDSLLSIWANEFVLKVTPCKIFSGQITGNVSLSLIEDTYSAALSNTVSEIQSKGGTVFWLQWLLLAGNNVLVKDYSVVYNLNSISKKYSRSGEALMKFKSGETFKVDARFAGTDDDNFITRGLKNIENDIMDILWSEISKYI